jgi:hypothetical protein
MLSRAAIEAVTNPGNVSPTDDVHVGARAVEESEVVAELRRLEGIGAGEARRLAREAVVHVGGHIERRAGRNGLLSSRLLRRPRETWWVPRSALRSS